MFENESSLCATQAFAVSDACHPVVGVLETFHHVQVGLACVFIECGTAGDGLEWCRLSDGSGGPWGVCGEYVLTRGSVPRKTRSLCSKAKVIKADTPV